MTQELIPDVSLIDNSGERVQIVLVLDCSLSMKGLKLQSLQTALAGFDEELKSHPKMAKAARVLVLSFGGDDKVEVGPWQDAMDFVPPILSANGRTPTGAAMLRALVEIEFQKEQMRAQSVHYKRPMVYLISDGAATDDWEKASSLCIKAIETQRANIYPIGVGDDANMEQLAKFSTKGAIKLDGLKFRELFVWIRNSIEIVSDAVPGQVTQLPPTDTFSSAGT